MEIGLAAIVLATGSNQDGRTSSMTVPGEEAQEALSVRRAVRLESRPQVQYFEAHGTGTLVGDPIEARALGAVLETDVHREAIASSARSRAISATWNLLPGSRA